MILRAPAPPRDETIGRHLTGILHTRRQPQAGTEPRHTPVGPNAPATQPLANRCQVGRERLLLDTARHLCRYRCRCSSTTQSDAVPNRVTQWNCPEWHRFCR